MPRVAIVTGGAGALGQAVTLRLLGDGGVVSVPWVVEKERERLTSRVPAGARDRFFEEHCDTTHAAEAALLQDAKQLHLHPRAHLANLVEEDRALLRDLEQTLLVRICAREGAAHVTEHLRLEERFRHRAAVERHHRLVAAE